MDNEGLIVVGVDGSPSARTALQFALEEATRRSARVRAVIAYRPPEYWPVTSAMAVSPRSEPLAEAAQRIIDQTVAEVIAASGRAEQAVPVDVRVLLGNPARVLLEQAAGADLLVVGHRGLGGFASMTLGSVGLQCVLYAPCPLTIVRPTRRIATRRLRPHQPPQASQASASQASGDHRSSCVAHRSRRTIPTWETRVNPGTGSGAASQRSRPAGSTVYE
jgi:nucleotide-binding universal stress UspA family protein